MSYSDRAPDGSYLDEDTVELDADRWADLVDLALKLDREEASPCLNPEAQWIDDQKEGDK